MDALFLLLDAALVGALGLWMVVAVADNWLNPVLNRDAVKMVVTFELMALEYPEHYQQVAHRKITRETPISLFFPMNIALAPFGDSQGSANPHRS